MCCSVELNPIGKVSWEWKKTFPLRKAFSVVCSHWPQSSDGLTERDFYWKLARWPGLILWVKSRWPSSASSTDNQQHLQPLLPPYSCHLHVDLMLSAQTETDSLLCWRSHWLWILKCNNFFSPSGTSLCQCSMRRDTKYSKNCKPAIVKFASIISGLLGERKEIQIEKESRWCFVSNRQKGCLSLKRQTQPVWSTVKTMLPNNQWGK